MNGVGTIPSRNEANIFAVDTGPVAATGIPVELDDITIIISGVTYCIGGLVQRKYNLRNR